MDLADIASKVRQFCQNYRGVREDLVMTEEFGGLNFWDFGLWRQEHYTTVNRALTFGRYDSPERRAKWNEKTSWP